MTLALTTPANHEELPVFASHEVVWDKQSLQNYCQDPAKSQVVRYIKTPLPGQDPLLDSIRKLSELIEITELTLGAIAERVKAKLPNHTWGLAERPADYQLASDRSTSDLLGERLYLPSNHCLVAQIDIIRPEDELSKGDQSLLRYIGHQASRFAATDNLFKTKYWAWEDAKVSQFVIGRAEGDQNPSCYLVDIEPFFSAVFLPEYD